MNTEEQITMMKLAGLEIVTMPAGLGLRRAEVFRGHQRVSESPPYPEDAQGSAIDIIFHYYLQGVYERNEEEEKRLASMVAKNHYQIQIQNSMANASANLAAQQYASQLAAK